GAAAGIALGNHSGWLSIPAMIAAGAIGGAALALVPAVLRAFSSTNEIITSLMLNYVGALVVNYLIFDSESYWRDTSSPTAKVFPQGKNLPAAASWPVSHAGGLYLPFGLLLGLVLATVVWLLYTRTRFGFEATARRRRRRLPDAAGRGRDQQLDRGGRAGIGGGLRDTAPLRRARGAAGRALRRPQPRRRRDDARRRRDGILGRAAQRVAAGRDPRRSARRRSDGAHPRVPRRQLAREPDRVGARADDLRGCCRLVVVPRQRPERGRPAGEARVRAVPAAF